MKQLLGYIVGCAMAVASLPAFAQFAQTAKLVPGPDSVMESTVGESVSVSEDGRTALISGSGADPTRDSGEALVFERSRGQWAEVRLMPMDLIGGFFPPNIISSALSRRGKTAIIGVPFDNHGVGAAVIFESSFGQWNEQAKLVPTLGQGSGVSVALSGDGDTALLGSPAINGGVGATFVFVRRFGVWREQAELIGTDTIGPSAREGSAVALSDDGNTAAIGGTHDDPSDSGFVGATWVFTRRHGEWRQEAKLVGTGFTNPPFQGESVAISADGNTIIVGGPNDDGGAAWVFTRFYGAWSQQGPKLVGSNIGHAVALSGDGDTAVIGGGDDYGMGAAWVFTRHRGVWSEKAKLVGTGAVGDIVSSQGYSVAISGDGRTVLSGAPWDGDGAGAAWVFGQAQFISELAGADR